MFHLTNKEHIKVEHECSECKTKYPRYIAWEDPSRFIDPKSATIEAAFLCPSCRKPTVYLYMLKEGKVVEIIKELPPNNVYRVPKARAIGTR